jgi:MFS family permease
MILEPLQTSDGTTRHSMESWVFFVLYKLTINQPSHFMQFSIFFGKLYTVFGVKTVFMTALGAYEIGSLLSAIAPTSAALVIGRAVSGFGCAGLIAGTFVYVYSVHQDICSVF